MDGWVQSKNVKCDAGKKSLIILDIQKQYFYSLRYKNNLKHEILIIISYQQL